MFRAMSRSRCALWLPLLLVIGCGQPVREDRSINHQQDGDAVAFQHGNNGVFVADKDGAPKKIFQPPADVLATSSPLWSPTDKRLIFTTAKQPGAAAQQVRPAGDGDPAGRIFFEGPTTYTCWLRDEEKDGQAPEPVALFDAACDHPGYVAANLAVRWHPDGRHILFIQVTDNGEHGVFEFDLQTKKHRQVFAHTAEAVVFDWAPDNEHLVCVLGSKQELRETDGVWVGKPGEDDWWRIPQTAVLAQGELPAALERLRATRPAWSRDGKRFAFVSTLTKGPKNRFAHELYHGRLDTRQVERLVVEAEPVRDIRWSPDGRRLGYVAGAEEGTLKLVDLADKKPVPFVKDARGFIGWDDKNEHLAYVAADPLPYREGAAWTFFLLPNPRGRDAIWLAPADDNEPGRKVFSGMQVTFPQWSPKGGQLSLWATFNPSYRAWSSELLDLLTSFAAVEAAGGSTPPVVINGLRVRRGDPALLLNLETGALDWKAVNPGERFQVGHYCLLKRDYAAAWRWYERAGKDAQPEEMRQSLFFQYHCLTKLNQPEEAKAKHEQFERDLLPKLPDQPGDAKPKDADPNGFSATEYLRAVADPKSPQGELFRDLYAAEVFLSLDAADDGEVYFRDALKNAATDAARMSRAVLLSQFLLLQQKHAEYADLAGTTLLPLLLNRNAFHTAPAPQDVLRQLFDGGDAWIARLAVLPLCDATYMKHLSAEEARRHRVRLEELRQTADSDANRLWLDLMIETACRRFGDTASATAAAQRVRDNPAELEAGRGKDPAALVNQLRQSARPEEGRQPQ